MKMNIFGRLGICTVFYACLGHNSLAWAEKHVEHNTSKIKAVVYSPTIDLDYPQQVFWGDTHLHTTLSQDANNLGVRLGPEDAFRFARGGTVMATHGQKARLRRPLDFLVIADHAEGLGSMQMLAKEVPLLMKNEQLKKWRALQKKGDIRSQLAISADGLVNGWPDELDLTEIRQPAWHRLIKAAEENNKPGIFTALHGFEWSSWPGGSNLHRVVIFRDAAEKVSKVMPFSSNINDDPEALWDYMDDYQQQQQGQVLAIPHNGNLSNGLMFNGKSFDGKPLDERSAARRARMEPLYEVTQIKGDGEAHPLLSPNDEFADYETWDRGNFAGIEKTPEMLPAEYARSALKIGISLGSTLGTNPYKFGMIGSTDSHTALSTTAEDNFYGKHSAGMEPGPNRVKGVVGKAGDKVVYSWEQAASGYTAVWSTENTREGIWDAMNRKEVYATTGSRISLRFFGGWEFISADAVKTNLAHVGYKKGVPMGGDLTRAPENTTISFLIAATRDPMGANLDRIQVVKGWVDKAGSTHEKVYDVAWSNSEQRSIAKNGKLMPVGNTVDLDSASYTNKIGSVELSTVWIDPDFKATLRAFYYVRVLEIPTPRWVTYDSVRFGVEVPTESPKTHQERAYSSPIWYTP
jgi:hypothetical protein